MGAIRRTELIRCQKEEFPSPTLPSLCFLLLSAEEGTDNIFSKRNAHSALSADNDIISRHWRGCSREGAANIRNLMANTTICKDAVHSGSVSTVLHCSDATKVAIRVCPQWRGQATVLDYCWMLISSKCVTPMSIWSWKLNNTFNVINQFTTHWNVFELPH